MQPLLRDIKQMEITFPLHFLTFVMRSLVLKIHLQTNNSGHSFRHTLGDSFNFLQGLSLNVPTMVYRFVCHEYINNEGQKRK